MIVVEMSGSVCVCDDDGSDGEESGSVDDCGGGSVDGDGGVDSDDIVVTISHNPSPLSLTSQHQYHHPLHSHIF